MNKLILTLMIVVGCNSFAQENRLENKEKEIEKLSPAQRDELHLKKLTLDLGLNEKQQKEMREIIATQSSRRTAAMTERKANQEKGIKPTPDQRFDMANRKLDNEIEVKERIKKILSSEQFIKWENRKNELTQMRRQKEIKRRNKISKKE
ncbi:MAG: hypothetical protein H7199_12130 [Burkholderiales bacterium]|nr:hypothetical protein [Flavobacterium sp.]